MTIPSPDSPDVITNFDAAIDLIDLTGIGTPLTYAGQIVGTTIAAGSIGWMVKDGNTFVMVNTSGSLERIGGTDMRIELMGSMSLTSANITHM